MRGGAASKVSSYEMAGWWREIWRTIARRLQPRARSALEAFRGLDRRGVRSAHQLRVKIMKKSISISLLKKWEGGMYVMSLTRALSLALV